MTDADLAKRQIFETPSAVILVDFSLHYKVI